MSEPVIEFENFEKRFRGSEAVKGLTLSVPRGTVVGLIGRNGAGKTTAIRCLVGLQKPTSGRVRLLGEDPWNLSISAKQRLGYLSESGVPYGWATPRELIEFCAGLYPSWDREVERRILGRFRLDPAKRLKTMSLGQRRAVGLLLAVCPRPDVLVLDEPAANLDPVLRREFLEQVIELVADAQRTVFFSTHLLSDIERVADRLAILHEGELLLYQELDELKENVRRLRLIFDGPPPPDLSLPRAVRIRRSEREVLATVVGYSEETIKQIERETSATIETQMLGLEELFIDLVGDDSPVVASS